MNVRITVLSAQAQAQIKALQAELRATQAQMVAGNAAAGRMASGGMGTLLTSMTKTGSQMQWMGRQLQYNFTIPLVLAGGAATKFALDNETAMTRVKKVYGDGSAAFNQLSKTELPALGRAFEALSNHFGVAQSDAINIAADWAAAGASGIALAKSVQLTMETMILGEVSAAEATQALIAIQAQYGQSVDQLSRTIDVMNMIENQTGISMAGLMEGLARAAGVARSAGVDVQHLGAFMAALVPAAGSAANAGNALKTIFSRLLAPTQEASQVLGLMGINIADMSWKSLTGSQRLELLATKFQLLDKAQQGVVSAVIASRYQINKFDVLMRDITNTNGRYQESLRTTGDQQVNFAQRTRELNAVLQSNPQKIKQTWVIIQNAMADVIVPLLPYIVYLAQKVSGAVKAFSDMNPVLQKFILLGFLMLAVVGPILRYMGAMLLLIGEVGLGMLKMLGVFRPLIMLLELILNPFKAASAAMVVYSAIVKSMTVIFGPLIDAAVFAGRAIFTGLVAFMPYIPGIFATMIDAVATVLIAFVPGIMAVWNLLTSLMIGSWVVMETGLVTTTTALGPALTTTFTAIGTSLMAVLTALGTFLKVQFRAIWIGIEVLTVEFGAAFTALWSAFTAGLEIILVGFARAAGIIWRGLLFGIESFMLSIGPAIEAAWAGIMSGMAVMMEGLAVFIGTTARVMMLAFETTIAAARVIIFAAWQAILAISSAAVAAWEVIAAGFVAIWEMIGIAPEAIAGVFAAGITVLTTIFEAGVSAMAILGELLIFVVTNPWALLALVVVGILYAFKDQISKIWTDIVSSTGGFFGHLTGMFSGLGAFFGSIVNVIIGAFNQLPQGVQNAFMAVVKIVRAAAMAVYNLFSYLNPFAHHSPSLVENVTNGVAVVGRQFASLNKGGLFAKAISDINALKAATAAMGGGKWADTRTDVAKAAPKNLPKFDAGVSDYNALSAALAKIQKQYDAQSAVVDAWKARLDSANKSLDAQTTKLDGLKNNLQKLQNQYDAHQAALENFANAPIKGEKAMNDAIFNNEIASKKLRLELLKFQQVNGTVDDMRNKLALLQGDIETLTGQSKDLRMAGAGSDVLGPIQDQIDAMGKQRDEVNAAMQDSPENDLQKQIDLLQQQNDILTLTRDITFDPLHKQIDDLVNAQKELSFDEIINGIKTEQAAMAALAPQIDAATAAVDKQQAVVDTLTIARDAIAASYDAENAKLQALNDSMSKYNDMISQVTDALNAMGQAASAANALSDAKKAAAQGPALTPGAQNFKDAAGGNFADPGGFAKIGREGGLTDQSGAIDAFTKHLTSQTADMFGGIDIFGPLKDMWDKAWKWIDANIMPSIQPVIDSFQSIDWGGMFQGDSIVKPIKGALDSVVTFFTPAAERIKKVWDAVVSVAESAWDLFGGDIKKIFSAIVGAVKDAWDKIGPQLAKFGPLIGPFFDALGNLAKIIGIVLSPVIAVLLGVLKLLASIIANTIGPVLTFIINAFANFVQVIRGAVEIITGILTGDWTMAWQGVKDIVEGVFKEVWNIISGAVAIIWGIIKGFVEGIVGFFQWLWDELVGHSIVPDMVNAIIEWMTGMPGAILSALASLGTSLIKLFVDAFTGLWNAAKNVWSATIAWIAGLPQAVWDKMIGLKDKLVDVATQAWSLFWTAEKTGWSIIISWVAGLPQAVWDKMIALKDKLGDVATQAWNWFWTAEKTGWSNIIAWVAGLPQAVWDKMIALKDKLGDVASQAFSYLKSQAVSKWSDILDWAKTLPDAIAKKFDGIATKMSAKFTGMFDGIKDAFKSAMNWVISKWNDLAFTIPTVDTHIPGVGKVGGFTIGTPDIPLLARGGFITNGAQAIVGEGRSSYPEFVIPTDPMFRNESSQLLQQLIAVLGPSAFISTGLPGSGSLKGMTVPTQGGRNGVPLLASGGVIGGRGLKGTTLGGTVVVNNTSKKEVHINGNLEFPNIRSADDAEALIRNLESLAD